MTDGKPVLETEGGDFRDKLAALGSTFNTNPGFGLMGMLEGQAQRDNQAQVNDAPAAAQAAPGDDAPPEWFGLVNSAVQGLKQDVSQQVAGLRNEIQRVAQPAPGMSQADFDALDPQTRQQLAVDQRLAQIELNTHYERARNSLNRTKQDHPDFEYTEKDLQDLWQNRIAGNVDAARQSDFDGYFESTRREQMEPKIQARLKALEAENSQLKSGRSNVLEMSSVPRGNRQSVTPPAQSGGGDFDEDVYRDASKNMGKGRFSGFGRALYEAQQRRSLASAR